MEFEVVGGCRSVDESAVVEDTVESIVVFFACSISLGRLFPCRTGLSRSVLSGPFLSAAVLSVPILDSLILGGLVGSGRHLGKSRKGL